MSIETVGVVGLGLLGRGIVACLLGNGLNVIAYTQDEATWMQTREHIEGALHELVENGHLDAQTAASWPQRYVEARSLEELSQVDFVIESITEDITAKAGVLARLEECVGANVPIASNTSAIPITLMQQSRRHPQRLVGMHWGEPCHVLRFLEIIRGEQTDDATFDATVQLAYRLGKEPSLVQKDIRGFITNRLFYAMLREALYLLESGVADAETIDRSFRNDMGWWSTIAGPFRWMDMTGIAAYQLVMKDLFPALCNSTEVPGVMQEMVDSGGNGIYNGRGFYEYSEAEGADWERRWHEFTWEIKKLAEKYVPVES